MSTYTTKITLELEISHDDEPQKAISVLASNCPKNCSAVIKKAESNYSGKGKLPLDKSKAVRLAWK